ncbi:hypothetical protein CROQUDRAFT_654234 [Cronartium quercuum f. sp. fusiforme G11]|uniref:Uncharacterized protein n=1 Tax=Cronartium quercuum f. sp. fusiforme G11 TaxID=708437 RepID=A0A9P6TEI4_9BASI|nr:hypothetical protein CROQUDRAFT_654234 [Cronartium quercuum f. sp. fusiforme G11]
MGTSVEDSIYKLSNALKDTRNLQFIVRNAFSDAVLSKPEEFESRYIREVDEAEESLFHLAEQPQTIQELLAGISDQGGNELVTDKSFNGKSKASQMNTTRQQREAGDAAATRSSLMAIQKLLQVHPMPRLEEHVNALVRQLDTLESSIVGLQDQLQLYRAVPSAIEPTTKGRGNSQSKARLKEILHRESLEVLALTDLRDEKRAQSHQLSEKIASMEMAPSPKKQKVSSRPRPSTSLFVDEPNPFIFSGETEHIRKALQRVKSPKVHQTNQIGSSTLDDDNHLSMTPTPKTPTQRRLIQSLTKLKSRAPGGTRLQALQLTVSPKLAQIPIEPPPNPPSPPKVEQEPIRDSLLDEPVPQSPTLPQSRLESLSRLVTSFWKSSTVIDVLTIYDPNLQIRLEKGNGTLNHQQTIETLENLINSYQSDTTGSVTPNKLIEAHFYLELLKTLSDKGSNNLPCILHQDQWCVPLESMKQKLISICQANGFNCSINTTIIYLLVGKLVIKIDRRANPILICVC